MLSDFALFFRILFWVFIFGFAFPLIGFAYNAGKSVAYWLKALLAGQDFCSKDKKSCRSSGQSVGKIFYRNESLDSVDFNGLVEMDNVTLHDSLNVNGKIVVHNSKINKISCWGSITIKDSTVYLIRSFGSVKAQDSTLTKIKSCGELKLKNSTVLDSVTLESISVFKVAEVFCPKVFGCKVKLQNSSIQKNLIINDSVKNQKLTIFLENSSIVGGVICSNDTFVEIVLSQDSSVGFTEGNVTFSNSEQKNKF